MSKRRRICISFSMSGGPGGSFAISSLNAAAPQAGDCQAMIFAGCDP
jgi:hypothetical protein